MANELRYGDQIHLLNLYQGDGGYLDSNGNSCLPGARYAVSTATVPTRGAGAGAWEIVSGSCKSAGVVVLSGDMVYLRNLCQGDGGYLDVNGPATPTQQTRGALYGVSTAWGKDRDGNCSRWQIFDQHGSPQDGVVRFNDTILLWNTYGGRGGFLETNDTSTLSGARHQVDTSPYANRDHADVGGWKILRP